MSTDVSNVRQATSPSLKVGALVLDERDRVLLVRSCQTGESWGIPFREAEPLKRVMLTVIKLMHDELGVLTWPVRVLSMSEELDEESGRHDIWIVYSVSMLTRMSAGTSVGTYEEAKWFGRQALPTRLTPAAVDALKNL